MVKKKIMREGKIYAYYQLVESRWIKGKSIPKVIKHLGTPKKILKIYGEYEKIKNGKQKE